MTKYAVSLPTQKIYNKYMKWAKSRGRITTLIPWSEFKDFCAFYGDNGGVQTKSFYLERGYTIITAQEAMGDINFKVGMKLRLLEDYNGDQLTPYIKAGEIVGIKHIGPWGFHIFKIGWSNVYHVNGYKGGYEIIKEEISGPIGDPRDYKTDLRVSEKTLNNMIKSMEPQYKTGDGVKQYKHPKLGWIATLEATEGPMNGVYTMDITASGRPEWKVFVPEELLALGFEEIKQPEIPEWIEKAHEEFIPFRDKKSFISCILKHLPPTK